MKEFLKPFFNFDEEAPIYIRLAGITYPDASYRNSRANSSVAAIEYILEGDGYIELQDGLHRVCKDTIYILHKGEDQNYYADSQNPYQKIFINVTGSLYDSLISSYGLKGKHFFKEKRLKSTFEKILEIIKSPLTDAEMQSKLQGIFIEIISRLSVTVTETQYSKEALALKNHLDANLHRFVSGKELGEALFRSPDYCQKLFLREFSITPYAYQLCQKLQKAKALLAETKMPIGEIAESLGYMDQHYFSNLFYQKCGCRPKDYRRDRS